MKNLVKIFILISIITSCGSDDCCAPQFEGKIVQNKTFGGSTFEEPSRLIATNDGGFAVVGTTTSKDGSISDKTNTSYDFWLTKFNKNSEIEWTKTYGGSDEDRGQDVIQTSDGGFALLGYVNSKDGDVDNNEGLQDFWFIKTDSQGNVEWQKTYGYEGQDRGFKILDLGSEGFAIGGFLDVTASELKGKINVRNNSNMHNLGDFWVLKITTTGEITWANYFGGNHNDEIHAMEKMPDGGILLTGYSESIDVDIKNPKGQNDIWAVKIDKNGKMVWEKSYGGSSIEEGFDVIRTKENTYIIVGKTNSDDKDVKENFGRFDIWMIEIDQNGKLLQQKSIGGSGFETPSSISPSSDGGFWISGFTSSQDGDVKQANKGENDAWLIKTDRNGKIVWQNTYGGSDNDFGIGAIEISENNVILLSQTYSLDKDVKSSNGDADGWILQLK